MVELSLAQVVASISHLKAMSKRGAQSGHGSPLGPLRDGDSDGEYKLEVLCATVIDLCLECQ